MQRFLFILISLLLYSLATRAQNNERVRFFNAEVYRLSLQEKWDSVLYYSRLADQEGIDSYELTYSKGKAYYAKSMYRIAYQSFLDAASLTDPGSDLKSYLYYSAKFSGMNDAVRFWRLSMSSSEREKFHSGKFPVVENISAGSSFIFSNNTDKNGTALFFPPEPIVFDSSTIRLTGDIRNNIISAGFGLFRRLGLFLSLNETNTEDLFRLAFIEYAGAPLSYANFPSETKQKSVYIALPVLLGKSTSFVPAFHSLSVQTKSFHEGLSAGEAVIADTAFTEFVSSAAISVERSRSGRTFAVSWSQLCNQNQFQFSFVNTWYPGYNLNRYRSLSLVVQSDGGYPGFAAGFLSGWKLTDFLWLESSVRLGKMSDFNDFNGYTVFNNGDVRLALLQLNPVVLIGSGLSFSLIGNLSVNKLPVVLSDGSTGTGMGRWNRSSGNINTNYYQLNLTGSLIWKL